MAHFSEIGRMIRTFGSSIFRLDDDIEGLAVSPDGKWVAISTDALDGQIRILDAATGKVRATFAGTADSLAFVDDVTLWSGYAQLHRWRIDSEEPTFSSTDHGSPIAMSQRAGLLAAARRPRERGDVDLLSLEDGSVIRTLEGPGHHVSSLSFSLDGTHLAVGYEESASVFVVASGRKRRLAEPKRGLRRKVAFHPSGRVFVEREVSPEVVIDEAENRHETWKLEGDPDGSALSSSVYAIADGWSGVRLLDARNGKPLRVVPRRGQWGPMAFLSDNRLAVATSNHLLVVEVATGTFEETAPGHDDGISAIALTRDGAILATAGGFDHTVHLWRAADGTHLHALVGHDNYITSIAFSPDGKTLASGCHDGALRIFDVSSGELRQRVDNVHGHTEIAVAYSSRGDLATIGANGHVALHDPKDGTITKVIARLPQASNMDHGRIAFDSSGEWLGCMGPREEISVLHAAGEKIGQVAFTAPASGHAMAFALDAPMLAYREGDEVVLASMPSGRVIARRKAPNVTDLAFLPRQRLAIVSHRSMPEIFDTNTGRSKEISLPNVAAVAISGVGDDELFAGLCNGTAVLANVGSTSATALAQLRALVQRLGTSHQFVGYRDAPLPASAPDDPSTIVVTRGEVTIHARVDAEDDEHWTLALSLPDGIEPAPPPPPPPPPPKPWFERAIASVRGVFAEATPPPTAAPSPTERSFVARGRFAELPSAEAIEEWVAAFARAHSR